MLSEDQIKELCTAAAAMGYGRTHDAILAALAERNYLRNALIQCGRSVGGLLADDVSSEFLMNVPGEVILKIARSNREE